MRCIFLLNTKLSIPGYKYATVFLLLCLLTSCCFALTRNGFDLDNSLIPVEQIFNGGPAKDGIPALDQPHFIQADQATFLDASDQVLGVQYQGIAKVYPVNILNWHEIVNDFFNQQPVVITFCPLCGSGMAFLSMIDNKALTFGVSGLLYNSDVLLYDRQTDSLWSQLMAQAISGSHRGKRLANIPLLHTTWQNWRALHPETLVLSADTGFSRDYDTSPYADYINSPQTMFPLTVSSRRYHPKEAVLGIEVNGVFRAYPFIELEKNAATFTESIGGQPVTIRYDRKHRTASAFDHRAVQLPAVKTFWFAWYAFHPKTEVYVASEPTATRRN